MFRVSQHPSSGVLKTVTAASGTGHNIGTATSLQQVSLCLVQHTPMKMHQVTNPFHSAFLTSTLEESEVSALNPGLLNPCTNWTARSVNERSGNKRYLWSCRKLSPVTWSLYWLRYPGSLMLIFCK